ncbi:MAG: GatB/YqeY domain-containing protein [Candidatus Omnitrophota bacterium]|nr:GatB/YqeY domain-containing protein [Candidatus Omnitrophota bacterium]
MLEKEITEAVKQALKAGEKVKLSALRMLISEIKNKKIADRVETLDDEKVIGIVRKMVRRHKESIEQFKQGGREDLVDKEAAELAVIEEYMPDELSEDEISRIISEVIEKTGAVSPKDMGAVMGAVMDRVKGRANGKIISRMVQEKLK